MSNFPPNGYNTISGFNKYKGTYFNNDLDVSGGNIINRTGDLYLASNSHIYTSNNHIQFDDIYSFINFYQSMHVFGQLQLNYNSVQYDVGERIEKIQDIYDNKMGTMTYYGPSDFNLFNNIYCAGQIQYLETETGNHIDLVPIVLNNQTGLTTLQNKTTNITFGTATTTISGTTATATLTFTGTLNTITPTTFGYISGLTSSAQTQLTTLATKLTNTSFATTTTTITGTTATTTLTFSGTLNTVSTTTFAYINSLSSNCQTQLSGLNNRITALETKTTPITYTAATVTTLISGVLQFSGTLNGWSTTNFSNAINYAKDLTSSAQSQINTINTNSVLLANNNIFTGNQTFNGTTTTIANTLASSTFTFSTLINGATKAVFDNVMLYGNSLSENTQTAINTLKTKLTNTTYNSTYNATTVSNTLSTDIFNFNTSINTISFSTFNFLYGVSSNIQDQFNTINNSITSLTNTLNGQIDGNITNLINAKLPIGSIIMSPLSTLQASTGVAEYLLCNGQNVSRTTYQNLFSRFSTTFGVGNGSTTFTLPNYQGLFMRGMGSQTINGTVYTGVAVNNAQQDSIQNHQHGPQNGSYLGTQTSASNSGGYLSSAGLQRPNQYNFDNTGTIAVSGRVNADETRVVNVGIYYYVKT